MPRTPTPALLREILAVARDHARCRALIDQHMDLAFRVFELSSHDEGAGDAWACILDGDPGIAIQELSFLMLFRLWAFAEFDSFEDLVTGGHDLGWLFEEIHRDLNAPAERGMPDTRPVRQRIRGHIAMLSNRFVPGTGSSSGGRSYPRPKIAPNPKFQVREHGKPSAKDSFDLTLLEGEMIQAHVLKDHWNAQIYVFQTSERWGAFEWFTSA